MENVPLSLEERLRADETGQLSKEMFDQLNAMRVRLESEKRKLQTQSVYESKERIDTMALTNTSINEIYKSIQSPMRNTENDLKSLLDTVPTGGDITTAQLLQLQTAISKYTLTSTIFSAIIKELSDSLKQTAAKIG